MLMRVSALAMLAFGLSAPLASADDLATAATKVTECRTITDNTSRLACLDAAALALSLALEQSPASAAVTQPPESSEPEEPKWARAPEPRKPRVEPEKQVAAVAPATPKEDKPPIWARVLRPDNDSDDEIYPVTIVRLTRNNTGRIFFHTESGQVWRQVKIEKIKPPKSLPSDAVIERSMVGSPRLSFDAVPNKSYKVRRVE